MIKEKNQMEERLPIRYKLKLVVKTKKEATDYVHKHLRGRFSKITKVKDGYAIYDFIYGDN